MTRPLYQVLSHTLEAALICDRVGNEEWFGRHALRLAMLVKEYMPRGSGFDAGTVLKIELQRAGELRFGTSFHHMDDDGYYRRWTSHEVIVTASLAHGFDLRVTGRDHNGIKEYLIAVFHHALMTQIAASTMAASVSSP
jgi:hypothetical protein